MGKAIEKVNPGRKRSRFTKEFKLEAVRRERARQVLNVQRGIRRRGRKDAEFQAFALLRASPVREQKLGDQSSRTRSRLRTPTVVMPPLLAANTLPACIAATALTMAKPSPWLSPLLVRAVSTR